jgi:DNA-binding MarR family transcriptional regulator
VPFVLLMASLLDLEIPAEVLRLRLPLTTRLVLAEIVALAGQPGCSTAHLAARLYLPPATASAAVRRLCAAGLVAAPIGRGAGRQLMPQLAAIATTAYRLTLPSA